MAATPSFPGLRRFPHGRRFRQWTGDDSKALMKVGTYYHSKHDFSSLPQVYLPAIAGHVPTEMVQCIGSFLDALYIVRRPDLTEASLAALDTALSKFYKHREIFRTSGVRAKGFNLPRQHSLSKYRHQIEEFGAPGGLCSSITESRHITAVKRPWRRSNRYEALGQMLVTNQRLDKLAASRVDFVDRGMVLPTHSRPTQPKDPDNPDGDEGPVDDARVTGHVILARTRGMWSPDYLTSKSLLISSISP